MYTLTKDDIANMRQASTVGVIIREADGGSAALRLFKDVRVKAFNGESAMQHIDHTIDLDGSGGITLSRANGHRNEHYAYKAWFYLSFCQEDGAWQMLLRTLKVGDEIFFTARTNNNQYVESAGLFADELLIDVHRNGKRLIYNMLLKYSVTADNTARAIQKDCLLPETQVLQ